MYIYIYTYIYIYIYIYRAPGLLLARRAGAHAVTINLFCFYEYDNSNCM